MIDVMSRLGEVKVKTAEALRASEADERASVVLVAVVREFDSKADKANRQANARDSVIELEQAGDSAKAAGRGRSQPRRVGPTGRSRRPPGHLHP